MVLIKVEARAMAGVITVNYPLRSVNGSVTRKICGANGGRLDGALGGSTTSSSNSRNLLMAEWKVMRRPLHT